MSEGAAAPAPEAEVAPRIEEPAADVGGSAKDASDVLVVVANPGSDAANEVATDTAPAAAATKETKEELWPTNDKQPTPDTIQDKPATSATTPENVEMKGEIKTDDAAPAVDESAEPGVDTPASAAKSKARRKSGSIPEHKNKKLNKKASKAKMTHTDAKPGDYFFVRLKGYPPWPAIVCDESMLPTTLLKSRPVTAARVDGTYRADYEDGGSKVKDRTFPVMYLHTNEFGWVPNTDLYDLDFDTVGEVTANMRKDLHAAHVLAAEKHDLDYFKEILKNFMEARQAEAEAKEAAKAAKKASKAKRQSKVTEDVDVEMADAPAEPDSETAELEATSSEKPKKSNKRKAEEDAATPQRTDSVKKPKTTIKLTNNTSKTNGASTPKTPKEQSASKAPKSKTKKVPSKTKEPEVVAPKEPELSLEEKQIKKEKEILFLRHKLQKGLLGKDQEPKEDEMKQMSEYVSKLEGYADLEVSIIRATKINKVLKAILKLAKIPREEEFEFKKRSQALLEKWNKILAKEEGTPVAAAPPTNGTSEETKSEVGDAKDAPAPSADTSNGIKDSPSEENEDSKVPEVETPAVAMVQEALRVEDTPAPLAEEPVKESVAEQTPVEPAA